MHIHPRRVQQVKYVGIRFKILVNNLAFVFDETGGRF